VASDSLPGFCPAISETGRSFKEQRKFLNSVDFENHLICLNGVALLSRYFVDRIAAETSRRECKPASLPKELEVVPVLTQKVKTQWLIS
jgi:hypothetical protein